jgi:hypothetical protein
VRRQPSTQNVGYRDLDPGLSPSCVRRSWPGEDTMAICEADPWRMQYFADVPCPPDVNIPTEDGDAWSWYPRYRWVYNKLAVAESQGLLCAPHGVDPPSWPVFSKPVLNMRGMGAGSRMLRSQAEYRQAQRPGHLWMELLSGEHVSTDVAVQDGEPCWWRHARGIPLKGGMFDYWIVEAEAREPIRQYGTLWIRRHLPEYTGMVNFETIGEKIIEVHLRFSDQWPDLYGRGWVEALVGLYAGNGWHFEEPERRTGYSVVLFGAHRIQYRHPPADVVDALRREPGVSSIQITFHEDRPPEQHSMPPGGFRLAIVNGHDLEFLKHIREQLALSFWSTQSLIAPRKRRGVAVSAGGQ